MRLPAALAAAAAATTEHLSTAELAKASSALTDRYTGDAVSPIETEAERAAYLAVRLPATFAAVSAVMTEAAQRLPEFAPTEMLDLGAGPGTALWAAAEQWPSLADAYAYEQDMDFAMLGQRLGAAAPVALVQHADWRNAPIHALEDEDCDLVVLSYVVGELHNHEVTPVVRIAWKACSNVLIVVEPGTPRGFQRLLQARAVLIKGGATIVAPCPHDSECPLGDGDWCHFAARIERTPEHMAMKGGTLGFEDEKYCYLIASRGDRPAPTTRILKSPRKRSGHVLLDVCTASGVKRITISKKHGEAYKRARKSDWGDAWSTGED